MAKLSGMFPKEFLVQVAGAITAGVVESALCNYAPQLFGAPSTNPVNNPAVAGIEPLLTMEQWIALGGTGIAGWFLSRKSRSVKMARFGEGMVLYALPRIVSREMVRVTAKYT